MATDARLATGLPAHPKTKKLIKRLGQAAAWNLVCLILWAADNRSDGDLSGMSTEDIELSADWSGNEGQFVAALVAVRFLDGQEGAYMLHDWAEHNPWAAGAESRSAKARWNAAKRHHGIVEADRLVPEYAAIRIASSNASSTDQAQAEQGNSNAPSPSPSPSHSVAKATGDKSPDDHGASVMDDKDKIFTYGVPMLVNAGTTDKAARSFLAGLAKGHGDASVVQALRDCIKAKAIDPLTWLAGVLPPKGGSQPINKQVALEKRNRAVADQWLRDQETQDAPV